MGTALPKLELSTSIVGAPMAPITGAPYFAILPSPAVYAASGTPRGNWTGTEAGHLVLRRVRDPVRAERSLPAMPPVREW